MPPFRGGAVEVAGCAALTPTQSTVDANGRLRQDPIDGVRFRPTRPVPHEDGTVAEVARVVWPEIDVPIVQVHITTTFPGRIRAWGLHRGSTDRLFVVKGLVLIVVYDARTDSPTYGCLNEFRVSERNPGLLVIPPSLFHGWKNIGVEEAFMVNMPSSQYDYEGPAHSTCRTSRRWPRRSSRSGGGDRTLPTPLAVRNCLCRASQSSWLRTTGRPCSPARLEARSTRRTETSSCW